MLSTTQLLMSLLIVIAAVAFLAARLQIPLAILLVLTGVVLALALLWQIVRDGITFGIPESANR
jgi:hypothetical protein